MLLINCPMIYWTHDIFNSKKKKNKLFGRLQNRKMGKNN